MTKDGDIDYSGYSRQELLEALDVIDRSRYPENLQNLSRELATRPPPPQGQNATAAADARVDSPGSVYAGFWRRLLACSIDVLLTYPLTMLNNWGFEHYRRFHLFSAVPMTAFMLFYYVYLVRRYGGTPGKRISGLKICTSHGTSIGYEEAFLRCAPTLLFSMIAYAGMIIASLTITDSEFLSVAGDERAKHLLEFAPFWFWPAFAAMGVWFLCDAITMLMNHRRRALHDYLAGTVVFIESRMKTLQTGEPSPLPAHAT